MIFACIAILIVVGLLWFAYSRLDKVCPPAKAVTHTDQAFEVFRDMEPGTQVRENPWIGFLQEDLAKGRTGPIGDFSGNDSKSGNAPLYVIT
jgi:hypothetical protein